MKLGSLAGILTVVFLMGVPISADAMPMAPATSPDSAVTLVAGGCGAGWHPGRHGGCRRNWDGPHRRCWWHHGRRICRW
jgi:hypothetical protein